MARKGKRQPIVAAILSFLVPGLGQIYCGKEERGAAILVAGIIVGTLALIWQRLEATRMADGFLDYRITLALYAVVFWIWQVVDAYRQAK